MRTAVVCGTTTTTHHEARACVKLLFHPQVHRPVLLVLRPPLGRTHAVDALGADGRLGRGGARGAVARGGGGRSAGAASSSCKLGAEAQADRPQRDAALVLHGRRALVRRLGAARWLLGLLHSPPERTVRSVTLCAQIPPTSLATLQEPCASTGDAANDSTWHTLMHAAALVSHLGGRAVGQAYRAEAIAEPRELLNHLVGDRLRGALLAVFAGRLCAQRCRSAPRRLRRARGAQRRRWSLAGTAGLQARSPTQLHPHLRTSNWARLRKLLLKFVKRTRGNARSRQGAGSTDVVLKDVNCVET